MRKGRPENSRQDSQHHNAIDCADAELQPQNLQGDSQQNGIQHEISGADRDVLSPFQNGSQTRNATVADMVGKEKDHPADGIRKHTDGDHHVI